MNKTTEYEVDGPIGQANVFFREHPAAVEGPAEAWGLAQMVVDHAAFVLLTVNTVREERGVRDSVTAALLRRALLLSEGIRRCLFHSLEEPASALLRSLLDVDLNLALVTQDSTDRMAKRLAAYHFLSGQRHGERLLSHPDTRGGLLAAGEDQFQWTKDMAKRMKEYFSSPAFDEVREAVRSKQHWHGHSSVEAAFSAAGMITDYHELYSVFSPFTHSSNLDFDFAGFDDEGRPALKAIAQRDPARVQTHLQGMVLLLLRILDRYLEDREFANYEETVTVTDIETGESFQVHPISALKTQLGSVWGPAEGVGDILDAPAEEAESRGSNGA